MGACAPVRDAGCVAHPTANSAASDANPRMTEVILRLGFDDKRADHQDPGLTAAVVTADRNECNGALDGARNRSPLPEGSR